MLHGEIVGHGAAIVCVSGFRMSVARESDAICFIEVLGNSGASVHAGVDLGADSRRGDKSREDNDGEEPQFARHGWPFSTYCEKLLRKRLGAEDHRG